MWFESDLLPPQTPGALLTTNRYARKENEFLEVDHLLNATKVYALTIRDTCGAAEG